MAHPAIIAVKMVVQTIEPEEIEMWNAVRAERPLLLGQLYDKAAIVWRLEHTRSYYVGHDESRGCRFVDVRRSAGWPRVLTGFRRESGGHGSAYLSSEMSVPSPTATRITNSRAMIVIIPPWSARQRAP